MIIVYVPCKDQKEAKSMAKTLLKEKLIACANTLDSQSIYSWKNKLEETKESILLLKTTSKLFNKTKQKIKQLHSYKLPAIIKLKVTANKKYENWIVKQTL